ncbi:hypothetical protein A2311_01540 [candidate division WOR-1 bacterium RIFOXYB2_FULL_48_7]|uniref:Uncharacterized protein n=1 Tax=candidate division WOR-1 bacterium RIFOXYB2_FULL_48_7 TaxID=1802583 RepID=A0A1F4TRG2_UNCSA|nr:MAG: hypothetical protein A2311_01540 [candidate division WOR-1 bacterium RIFOXYB2_FULL_48_7]
MATQAQAVSDVAQTLDSEYQALCNMMSDISDGVLDGTHDGYKGNATEWTGNWIEGSGTHNGDKYGYEIGGQSFQVGHSTGGNGYNMDPKDATLPGTMLQISTATSQQAVFTGQLTDTAMKAAQLQKAVSQKVG